MYGICTVTFNIKAFSRTEDWKRRCKWRKREEEDRENGEKKKQENTNSEKEDVTK